MGYDKDEDGNLIIKEEQAQVLRRIFQMFLMGQTPESIARRLNYEGGRMIRKGELVSKLHSENVP